MSRQAVSWSLAQQVGRQVANIAIYAVFAVLLPPSTLGLVAIGLAWTSFGAIFVDLGLSVALVQRKDMNDGHASSVFFLNIALGAVMFAAVYLTASPIASLYELPELESVIQWLSVSFLLLSFGITQAALAQRELRFRELAIRDISAVAVGGSVGIGMAYSGYEHWSLVTQALVSSAVAAVLSWVLFSWRPKLSNVSLRSVCELWDYSSKIVAVGILKYGMQNLDKVILGLVVGVSGTGIYALAEKMILIPVATFYSAIGAYLFSRFSALQDELAELRKLFMTAQRLVASLVFPAMVMVAAVAPMGVPLILKPEWSDAALLIQIFAAVAAARSLISPVGEIMKARGHAGWFLRWAVFFSAITMGAIVIGARWGVQGVGWGVLVAHLVGLAVNVGICSRLLEMNIPRYFAGLKIPTVGSVLVGVSMIGTMGLGVGSDIAGVLACIATGFFVYVVYVWTYDLESFRMLVAKDRLQRKD